MPKADNNCLLRGSWVCGAFLVLSTTAVLLRIGAEAWIGEDALITFRTIDNFVSGYGLRWNIDERVQVYTHPLWMFVNAVAYATTREIPYTLTAVSLVFSVGAYLIVASRLLGRPLLLLVGFLIPFMASKSLVFYGTSGFETPLAFFLLALFAVELLPKDTARPTHWGRLALYAALAAVNRLDHILLFAPPLLYLCISNWRRVRWDRLTLGLTPLGGWLLFSLLYYGFAFPNTARAKLSTEIPLGDYVREGILYTANLVNWDPMSVPILVISLVIAGGALVRSLSEPANMRAGCLATLGVGVVLYGGYILRIGGGFLSGRFWAAPLFASVLVIAFGGEELLKQLRAGRPRAAAAVVAGVAVLVFSAYALGAYIESRWQRRPKLDRSLAHFYLKPDLTWGMTKGAAHWNTEGQRLARQAQNSSSRYVTICGAIGFKGLAAGRKVTIIDRHALADPLLAQLPLEDGASWRIGHLPRPIPRGYVHARQTDLLDQMDPSLREYYRRLHLVVSGPVFTWQRLLTITGFNFGRYDYLLDQWKKKHVSTKKSVSD